MVMATGSTAVMGVNGALTTTTTPGAALVVLMTWGTGSMTVDYTCAATQRMTASNERPGAAAMTKASSGRHAGEMMTATTTCTWDMGASMVTCTGAARSWFTGTAPGLPRATTTRRGT